MVLVSTPHFANLQSPVRRQAVRILRTEIPDGPSNWHDMGYAYPVFFDWDSDGLNDLVCPNETNRILWYWNTGTKKRPRFESQVAALIAGAVTSMVTASRT